MRRLVLVALLLQATTAIAAEYGGETQGLTADELAALAAAGEVDAEALDALLSLRDEPPDPARASAEELGLLPGVGRAEARLLAEARMAGAGSASPLARLDAGALAHREFSPQGFARLRLTPTASLAGSALFLARDRARFDASSDWLSSDGPRRELGLERWYVTARLGGLRLVGGNFNCNFGDSLTFSSARRLYTATVAPADALVRAADARGLGAARALRGVAAQLEVGVVELTAFASYRGVDLYQYGEWQRDGRSPVVVLRGSGDPLRYTTFADGARESVAGVNLDVRFGDQLLGATAYAARAQLRDPRGVWSPSSIYPAAPGFGAVGLHALTQLGSLRGRAEVARSSAGGIGAVARVDIALGHDCDVGITGRYYGVAFDNPFTRSVAAPDQWEGARARNERGVELATALAAGRLLRVAASVDAWTNLSAPNIINGRARGRTTWQLTTREALIVEGDCVDKHLASAGAYAGSPCGGLDDDCASGARASGTARLVSERIWRSRVAFGGRHTRQDATTGVAVESRVTAHVTIRPIDTLAVSVVASERLTPRAPEIDGGKRLLALSVVGRLGDWASLELMARGERRWDAGLRTEPMTIAGALTLMVQR